jgi:hypothetical protein
VNLLSIDTMVSIHPTLRIPMNVPEQATSELKMLLSEETTNLDFESDPNESDLMSVSDQIHLLDWKRDLSESM